MRFNKKLLACVLLVICIFLCACNKTQPPVVSLDSIPGFSDSPYVTIDDNHPRFTPEEKEQAVSWEYYSDLDDLNRCGSVMACIGEDIMPTEDRGSIGQVKPTGWHTVKYDFVDGKYLYNRCHLIGYQLTGENANEQNLITGTRYMNVEGMLPFENMVADYVRETENHVLYRVTPCFEDEELVARGVLMEAWSVEDQGEGVCFFVYIYNAQPGVEINYATGESWLMGQRPDMTDSDIKTYILNINSMKFHEENCGNADNISENNRQESTEGRDQLIARGFQPAGCCDP